jgi:ABC-type Mn2+/Zn2+ transport system ATPase subunit
VNERAWLAKLDAELRRRGVDADVAHQVAAEARAHLFDSGQEPLAVFGAPAVYADAVAASLGLEGGSWSGSAAPAGRIRLRAHGIGKRFGRRQVLRDVDLTVRGGEVAAVIGANGSGKTTLLRICAGLLAPDRGEVVVDGALGYCPQHGGLADFLLPDEHFALFGVGRGMARTRARAGGQDLAATLCWDAADRVLTRDLSGGTRQKLNVVLSVLGDPDVLLLDEPYQGFDRGTYLDFWRLVWQWRDAGKAVVVVTHLLNQLDQVDTVLDLTPSLAGGRRP